jgi:hypothetical protein
MMANTTSIGNARIAGMADDLKLTSNEYSIALVSLQPPTSTPLTRPGRLFRNICRLRSPLQHDPSAHPPIHLSPRHHGRLGRPHLRNGCHPRLQAPRRSAHPRRRFRGRLRPRHPPHHLVVVQARGTIQALRRLHVRRHPFRLLWRTARRRHHRRNGRHRRSARMALAVHHRGHRKSVPARH